MSILSPIVSKRDLAVGVPQEIYVCPVGKTHAIIDIMLYKPIVGLDATIAIALSTNPNPATLTSVDYFISDFMLIGATNTAELAKLVVGPNEHVYINVISGTNVIARLTGVEEANIKVLKAGRLLAGSVATVGVPTLIFSDVTPSVSYISASVTLFNTSATTPAVIEAWVGVGAAPTPLDKVLLINVPANSTAVIENLILLPTEKVFAMSSTANMEYFVNGIIVSSI